MWLVALFAGPAAAQAEAQFKTETLSWCYPSGLRVLFEAAPGRSAVSVVSVVDGGSGAEPVERAGVAHLMEHLWFRTPVMDEIESTTGANHNAFTTRDDTRFTTTANRRFVRALLNAEVQRLREPLAGVTEEVLAAEREIVRNELRQRYDDTGQMGLLHLFSQLFPPDHPYHHAPIGSHQTLADIGLDDVRAYAERWYRPAHTTWYVSGDFTRATIKRLIDEAIPAEFRADPAEPSNVGTIPCTSRDLPPSTLTAAPPVTSFPRYPAAVAGPTLLFGWVMPPGEHEASLAEFDLWLVEVEVAKAVDREVSCGAYPGAVATVGFCALALAPEDDPERLLRRGMNEARQWFDPNHRISISVAYNSFDKARRRQILADIEAIDGVVADRPVEAAVHFHRTGDGDKLRADLQALVRRDFGEEAHFGTQWLTQKRLAAVVLEPASVEEWPVTLHSLRGHGGAARTDASLVDAARLETFAVEPDLGAMVEKQLPNGLTVHLVPFGGLPLVRAEILVRRDAAEEDLASSWFTRLALRMTAAGPDTWVEDGWSSFSWGRTETNAVNAVTLLKQELDEMRLGEFRPSGKLKDLLLTYQAELDEDPSFRASRARTNHLFEGASLDPDALAASVEAVSKKSIATYRDSLVRPERMHLIVVGGFEPSELLPEVERQFGVWRGTGPGAAAAASAPAAAPSGRAVEVFAEPNAVMSDVVVACRVDGAAPLAGWDVLEGLLNTALTEKLRESAGVTYGITVRARTTPAGAVLQASTKVPHEAVGLAVSTVLDEWRQVAAGVEADVLAAEKLSAAKRSALHWQTTWALLALVENSITGDRPVTAINGLAQQLAALTPADLAKTLAPCVGSEVVTVVGHEDRAAASLAAAGVSR